MFIFLLNSSLWCLYWYRNGIFHRDVKPENILIKVINFMWDYLTESEVYQYFSLYSEKVMFLHE